MSYSNPYSNPVNFEGVRERSLMFRYRLYLQYLVAQGHPRTSILSLGVKWSQVQILSARRRSEAVSQKSLAAFFIPPRGVDSNG